MRRPEVDGWYHVMGRGLERRERFTEDRERERFLDLLAAVHETHGLARRYSGLTLREVGEAVGGKDYAAVSMAIKRLEQRMATERTLADIARQLTSLLSVET